jgi:hypothetical protein
VSFDIAAQLRLDSSTHGGNRNIGIAARRHHDVLSDETDWGCPQRPYQMIAHRLNEVLAVINVRFCMLPSAILIA